ncbi:hypothetical protein B9Q17_00095 [Marinobacter vinifirmus]|uniref:Uncharacterized protein n=1 Tax=Marinobacter vinifirmus TaxID=355591 RepID=A0A7Z1DS21_9GAMM|nr:hypothetical protein [Marinobacter vinifirmus]OZC34936.1 hypothetical protein B9Q17_00095 [Marinobacter vinifirmus]
MSRHFFKTLYQGKPATVLLGYDQPLNGFFMVIEEDGQESDEYIYSNLFDEVSHPSTLEPYRKRLNELGIFVPIEMIMEVEADGAARMGNKNVYHSIVNGTHRREVD